MNRIIPTALAAAALATGVALSPVAEAKTVYIAGTRGITEGAQPPAAEVARFTAYLNQPVYVVQYPRDLAPYRGTTPLDKSVQIAVVDARQHIEANDTLICYSQGCLASEILNRDPASPPVFNVNYGDPTNRDGGIVTKLPQIPTVPRVPATPDPTRENYSIEYDIIADAPDKPNPVSYLNAGLGFVYDHSKYSTAYVEQARKDGRLVLTGDDEYGKRYLIKQDPKDGLPLTRPIRQVEKGLTGQTRVSDTLDRVLKPVVDSGYNDVDVRNGNKVTPKTTTTKKEAKDDDDTTGRERATATSGAASGVSRGSEDAGSSHGGDGEGAS